MGEKTYYSMDPMGKLMCHKCRRELVRGKAVFSYLGNAFPVELPVCPDTFMCRRNWLWARSFL